MFSKSIINFLNFNIYAKKVKLDLINIDKIIKKDLHNQDLGLSNNFQEWVNNNFKSLNSDSSKTHIYENLIVPNYNSDSGSLEFLTSLRSSDTIIPVTYFFYINKNYDFIIITQCMFFFDNVIIPAKKIYFSNPFLPDNYFSDHSFQILKHVVNSKKIYSTKNKKKFFIIDQSRPFHYLANQLIGTYLACKNEKDCQILIDPSSQFIDTAIITKLLKNESRIQQIKNYNDKLLDHHLHYCYATCNLINVDKKIYNDFRTDLINLSSESIKEKFKFDNYQFKLWIGLMGQRRSSPNQITVIKEIINYCIKKFSDKFIIFFDGWTSSKSDEDQKAIEEDKKILKEIITSAQQFNYKSLIGFQMHEKIYYANNIDFSLIPYGSGGILVSLLCNKPTLAHANLEMFENKYYMSNFNDENLEVITSNKLVDTHQNRTVEPHMKNYYIDSFEILNKFKQCIQKFIK
jgi:hypothetical protein